MKDSAEPALQHFFVGPENRLVEVAIRAVLDDSDGGASDYNPLLLYGAPGTGKSHVALGLAAALRAQYPRSVVDTTGIDFVRELTDAIETQTTEEFRRRYREARLVVIDDVTRLADSEVAQLEMLHTLDAVLAAGHGVIATASLPPGQWPRILPSLQSRFGAGLTVPLASPGLEARLAILQQMVRERQIPAAEAALGVLARGLEVTARELGGALGELHVRAKVDRAAIDAKAARTYLASRQENRRRVDLTDIARATARSFSLNMSQLRSRSQRREVVTARGVAMYLARQLTDRSLAQIGVFFGGRDHTTVLHGCRKTEALLRTEPEVQQAVQRVQLGLDVV
jgi:chromosomal replication initiator protein